MKIIWEWSLDTETTRVLEMSRNIGSGFYHLHHFLPLPFNPKSTHAHASHHVYLPILPYSQIPRYWESVVKLGVDYPYDCPPALYNSLRQSLSPLALPPLPMRKVKDLSKTYLPQIVSWLHQTFPALPLPNKILIHPSYFGTIGSFSLDLPSATATLYLRHDQDLHALTEILLTALLRPHAGNTLYSDWEKTEYLVDYLLLESSLKSILPPASNWRPTTTPPHHSTNLRQQSTAFLTQIGAPQHTRSRFTLQNHIIYFNLTPLSNLTAKETAILTALISCAPAPLTTDKLADLIFTNDDKFSLAALTKTVERLRKKLNSLGISSSYLATASGVGYYLKN